MFLVGLTGGIGSGKSTAAERFTALGVTIVNSDAIAREIVLPDSKALNAIRQQFGFTVLQADGSLNRAALRAMVFADPTNRAWLEKLTHPLIANLTEQRLNAPLLNSEAPYRILESPLLLETNGHDKVDIILLIDAPQAVQLQRTMQRDNNSEDQVMAIISSQMPREQKHLHADDIVDNAGSLAQINQKIDDLHQHYCELANKKLALSSRQ